MTYADTLATSITLNATQYVSQSIVVVNATNRIAGAIQGAHKAGRDGGGFGRTFDGLKESASDALSALAPLKTVIAGILGIGAAGAAGGLGLMRQAAEFDSLRQSLVSVEGDAKKAGRALADLKELAKAPGLGFEEAVRGYSGLRNAGLSQQFAERLIKELANANARGGGSAETFGRILTQIRQAAGRNFLAQEDLSPIGEAGIPINSILKGRYGTGDTEELKRRGITAQEALHGIVEELAKLPRVAGGAQNEFDNLGDALKFAAVSAGDALNQSLLPYVSKFAASVGELTDSGVIQSGFQGIADNVTEILGIASDDTTSALIPLIAGLQTLSGGFRNLTENLKGLKEFADRINRFNPIAWVGNGLKNKIFGEAGGQDDMSLGGEYERNVATLEAQLGGYRRKKKAATTTAADSPTEKATDPMAKQNTILERIAINTGRMVEALEDATSGGGSLANAQTGGRELDSIVGGYQRRFRRMGA